MSMRSSATLLAFFLQNFRTFFCKFKHITRHHNPRRSKTYRTTGTVPSLWSPHHSPIHHPSHSFLFFNKPNMMIILTQHPNSKSCFTNSPPHHPLPKSIPYCVRSNPSCHKTFITPVYCYCQSNPNILLNINLPQFRPPLQIRFHHLHPLHLLQRPLPHSHLIPDSTSHLQFETVNFLAPSIHP